MTSSLDGVYRIGTPLVSCHLLVSHGEAVMIDTGFIDGRGALKRLLRKLGLTPNSIRAILLTHGHLDHTGNLAWLKAWTGAPLYAHPAEQAHIDGTFPYVGPARWCGRLERIGRALIRYKPSQIDAPLSDGDELPFWGGLRVVHLPGHTVGHCGFFSEERSLLFSGDLFASYAFSTHLPPPMLNSALERFPETFTKLDKLQPRGIIPNHYDFFDPVLHQQRFARLRTGMAQGQGSRRAPADR